LRSGPDVPLSLPQGFTLYPDAKVITNTFAERRGKQRTLLVFETGDSIPKVLTFYRLQAGSAGAQFTLDLGGRDRASLGGKLRSGGNFTLTLRRDATTRAELAFE
jgi:hypothetical protein